ncbi:MAG: hypothetical protein ACRDQ4_13890 [Pseudonocardiaceae bacterium]
MLDLMSFAELTEQHVELLPARTVLSLWRAGTGGSAGDPGESGNPGTNGQGFPGFIWWYLSGSNRSGSGSSFGDASSKNS